jgi:hypothetical protein
MRYSRGVLKFAILLGAVPLIAYIVQTAVLYNFFTTTVEPETIVTTLIVGPMIFAIPFCIVHVIAWIIPANWVSGPRSRLMKRVLIASWIVIWTALILPGAWSKDAGGDWKGQVIDRETRQPIQDVIVLVVWENCIGWHGCGPRYADSEEVVTGADGRFIIRRGIVRKYFRPATPAPHLYLFKPGYGHWDYRGSPVTIQNKENLEALWREFGKEGVVIDLPPLQTKQEQWKFLTGRSFPEPYGVPEERMARWRKASAEEYEYVKPRRKLESYNMSPALPAGPMDCGPGYPAMHCN